MAQGEIAAVPTSIQDNHGHVADNNSHNFYQGIRQQFGDRILQFLKQFSKLNATLAKQRNRRIFLLRCKHLELTPIFLKFNLQHVSFQCKYLSDEFIALERKFQLKTLNLTLSDTSKNIRSIERKLATLKADIENSIPRNLFTVFLNLETKKN